jgi:hypothetical protein
MVTDEEVEAAARAIVETWAAEKMPGLTWAEAVQAEKEPDEFPALCTLAPLARKEARAALLAAEAARKPDDKKPGAMTQGLYVMLRKAVKSALYLADDGLILGDAADYGVAGVIDALVEHHLIDPNPSW